MQNVNLVSLITHLLCAGGILWGFIFPDTQQAREPEANFKARLIAFQMHVRE
jgi:hypothetical protein